MPAGSLSVVGTGIQVVSQTSPQAAACIEAADIVYFVSADALTAVWIRQINANAHSLNGLYAEGKDRGITYEETIDRVLESVFAGQDVCFVSYGHPGVFAYPTHEAIRRARAAGHRAQMLPAISADACLFADLGIDPSSTGCQSFEATDFLLYGRRFDCRCSLLLWQIGIIAEMGHFDSFTLWNRAGVVTLVEVLRRDYPAEHTVTVYEAPRYACCEPHIEHVALAELANANITPLSTLYVPPYGKAEPDLEMARRLLDQTSGRAGRALLASAPPTNAPTPPSSAAAYGYQLGKG